MIFFDAMVLATMLLVQRKRTVPLCERVKFNCGATPAGGEVFCCIFYGVYNNNNESQYNYIVSVYGNTMCYLNYREAEVQVLKRT